jgi:multiple sugar transport system permease protein
VRTSLTYRQQEKRGVLLFLTPAIVVLLVTSVFPLLYSLVLSTFQWNMLMPLSVPKYTGFANFARSLQDHEFTGSLLRTVLYVLIAVPAEFVLGLAIAFLVTARLRGLPAFRVALLMPLMMTPVVVGVLWRFLFNPEYGVVDFILQAFGGHAVTWLAGRSTAFASILIVEIWQQLPVVIFILAAGISSLQDSIFEAADIDGATSWQRFRLLTIPLLRPVIAVVLLLRIMDCFKVFDALYTLTYGGPGSSTELISLFIYKQGLKFFQIGRATSMSWLFLVVVFVISIFFMRQVWKEQSY